MKSGGLNSFLAALARWFAKYRRDHHLFQAKTWGERVKRLDRRIDGDQ